MIDRLTLTDFRNHKTLRVNADGKNVVLAGTNGAGKTNVLEAVSLLGGGPGFRRALSEDLARFGAAGYGVNALLTDGGEISVFWQNGQAGRRAKIDGTAAPLSALSERVRVVWLTPAEDMLFLDSPSSRRSFLDNLAAGFDGLHAGRAARLNKLMSERAFALKNGRDDGWLDLLEKNLAMSASAVADARVRYVAELNHFFEAGIVGLSGIAEQRFINGEKAGDFEDFYLKYLSENRFLTGDKMAVDGPHRADFSVKNLALNLDAGKTSAGQQKLLLARMVIAHAKLLLAKGLRLIVLLDEADGHLDKNARAELFSELGKTNAQIWLTGTDAGVFAGVPNSIVVDMEKFQ
jgi:DNA replication and repair protein RecF